jgi:hypothetical protein
MRKAMQGRMKKPLKTANRSNHTLGELIAAVSSSSRSSREAAATLADLFHSGRVCLSSRKRRLHHG